MANRKKKVNVELCFDVININITEKEVLIKLLKSDTVNAKQIINSVKKKNPEINFENYTFHQII